MSRALSLLASRRALTPDLRALIEEEFGERGQTALDAVDAKRVKRYLDFFVVIGRSDEYVVEDEFCTCRAAILGQRACWHVLAVAIAELTLTYIEVPLWYQETLNK
ncbi:MAG: SWIM zinc finger family protein [Methanomicrobiales archaeon]|nr:SWIM zinc finger family protein [Methanomicrobiales archaeon]